MISLPLKIFGYVVAEGYWSEVRHSSSLMTKVGGRPGNAGNTVPCP